MKSSITTLFVSVQICKPRVRHIPGLGVQKVPPGYRVWTQITGFRNTMGDAGGEATHEKIFDFVKKYWSSTGFIFYRVRHPKNTPRFTSNPRVWLKTTGFKCMPNPGGCISVKRGQISKWIWVSKPQPTIGIYIWGKKSSSTPDLLGNAFFWVFENAYVSKCRNITRCHRNMVDSAFESWRSILSDPKKYWS